MFYSNRLVQAGIVIVSAFFFMGLGQKSLQMNVKGHRYPSLMPKSVDYSQKSFRQTYITLGFDEMLDNLKFLTYSPDQEFPSALLITEMNSCSGLSEIKDSDEALHYKWDIGYGSMGLAPTNILQTLGTLQGCDNKAIHLVVGY